LEFVDEELARQRIAAGALGLSRRASVRETLGITTEGLR
jgi:hypothetical protein